MTTSVGTCREALLAALRRAISFDGAIGGSGCERPRLIFGVAAVDPPLERLADHAQWQDQDALRAASGQRPGVALRNEDLGPISEHHRSAIDRHFCAPSGPEHRLGIAQIDLQANVGELIFLIRSDPQRPFSDAERDLIQHFMPHLVLAWQQRLYRALADTSARRDASDPAFGLAMRAAFPDRNGPPLPPALAAALASGAALKAGPGHFRIQRGADRDLIRLVREGCSQRSRAEWQVARLFAEGLTARMVAERLGISPLTVRNHLTAIYEKLGLHSKAALARWIERQDG